MAIDPPYRLDPLQNITNVKWGDEDKYLSFVLPIVHSPTVDFQRTKLPRQNTDYSFDESEDPEAIGFVFWPAYVTKFQWIFARQRIVLHNWTGLEWQTCRFNLDVTPIEGFVIGSGNSPLPNPSNPDNKTKPPKTLTGLPSLPSAEQTVGAGTVCGAVGHVPGLFWPQSEWETPTGAPVTITLPNGQTKPVRMQVTADTSVPFVTCSSVKARMRGIELNGNSGSLPGGIFGAELVKAWIAEMDVGFNPDGGPVADHNSDAVKLNPDRPGEVFGDITINISGITAKQGTTTWKGKGAALYQPMPSAGVLQFARFIGAMYVLLEKQQPP